MAQSIFDQLTVSGYTRKYVKNTGTTAITAGLVVQWDTSDTSDDPAVKAIAAADTVTALAGVAVGSIAASGYGYITIKGEAVVLANGAITKGALVQTLMTGGACDGKAIALDKTITQEAVEILGQAITHAAAADDYLVVNVNIVPATTAA